MTPPLPVIKLTTAPEKKGRQQLLWRLRVAKDPAPTACKHGAEAVAYRKVLNLGQGSRTSRWASPRCCSREAPAS